MKRLLLITCTLVAGFGLGAGVVQAAVLAPAPVSETVVTNKIVRIDLLLDSEGESINALETTLTYQPTLIEIIRVDTGQSVFPLWVEQPAVDAAQGRVRLVAGLPNGTVTNGAVVASLLIQPRLTGTTSIGFDPAATSLLLNDGAGTRAQTTLRPLELTITHPNPDTPTLRSPSHPIAGRWSSVRDVVMEWMPYKDSFVSYRLSTNPLDVPDETTEVNTGQVTFPALTDGVWYFTLRTRLAGKAWSPVARYQLPIDGTDPTFEELGLVQESSTGHWLLLAVGADSQSGIANTAVRFETVAHPWWAVRRVGEWQTIASPADLGAQLPTGRVSVRLLDAAGNESLAVVPLSSGNSRQLQWLAVTLGAVLALVFVLLHLQGRRRRARKKS